MIGDDSFVDPSIGHGSVTARRQQGPLGLWLTRNLRALTPLEVHRLELTEVPKVGRTVVVNVMHENDESVFPTDDRQPANRGTALVPRLVKQLLDRSAAP